MSTDRGSGPNGSKTSPAVDALYELLFAGRGARMHVLFGGQLDTTPLGALAREQFSTRRRTGMPARPRLLSLGDSRTA